MVNFFNNTRPITILILMLLLFSMTFIGYYHYNTNVDINNTYIISRYYPYLNGNIAILGSVFLSVSLSLLINKITNDNFGLGINSFSFLFLVLFISSNFHITILSPILVSSLFIFLAIKIILSLPKIRDLNSILFHSGLLIGVASIFYMYAILYILIIFIAIFLFQLSSWRNFVIPTIGALIPYYLLFTVYFWIDKTDTFWSVFFNMPNYITSASFYLEKQNVFILVFHFILILFSAVNYLFSSRTYDRETNNKHIIIFSSILVAIIITIISPIHTGQELLLVFIPLSIIYSNFIINLSKNRNKIIFIATIVLFTIVSYLIPIYYV